MVIRVCFSTKRDGKTKMSVDSRSNYLTIEHIDYPMSQQSTNLTNVTKAGVSSCCLGCNRFVHFRMINARASKLNGPRLHLLANYANLNSCFRYGGCVSSRGKFRSFWYRKYPSFWMPCAPSLSCVIWVSETRVCRFLYRAPLFPRMFG